MLTIEELRARLDRFPRFKCAHTPTPLEKLHLNDDLRQGHNIYVKRDDCTGLALGGNKSRKLEFILGDALQKKVTTLITAGGIQSNMVRQTAAVAAKARLPFHAIVAPSLENVPRSHLDSGNIFLDGLFKAQIHLAPTEDDFDPIIQKLEASLKAQGESPYVIPIGASDGLGSLGYIMCAIELLTQFKVQGIAPKRIFVATGSGGTHAGLLAGLRYLGSDMDVIGISVSEPTPLKIEKVHIALDDIQSVLKTPLPATIAKDIVVYDDYTGAGYSHPTAEANAVLKKVAQTDGLLLDPIYTAKCFAGMIDLLGKKFMPEDGDSVFIHTGGTPALFADPGMLIQPEIEAPALRPLLDKIQ